MLALALQLALAVETPGAIHLGDPSARSAHLLAQSPPPLTTPELEQPATSVELKAELDALNKRIMAIDVNWPTGAVIAGYAGGILLYVTLIVGLAALLTGGLSPIPPIVVIAMGVGGAGLVAGAWVAGSTSTAEARERRETLIKERDALQQQLREQGQSIPFVQLPGVTPLVTLASF